MFVCSLGAGRAAAPCRSKVSDLKAKLRAFQSRDRMAQEGTRELRGQGSRLKLSQVTLVPPSFSISSTKTN